jgi:hypothetical protein
MTGAQDFFAEWVAMEAQGGVAAILGGSAAMLKQLARRLVPWTGT